jgi:molybdate transport system substrate-binding protein
MRVTAVLLGLTVFAGGCAHAPSDTLGVVAAASLAPTFTELGEAFNEANPQQRVEFSFGGSADLLSQLTHGAPGDVFAAADTATMDKAARAGLLAGPARSFASNSLAIAVAPGNPKGVRGFRDLAGVSVVVCAVQVPCGAGLPRLQRDTGVRLTPVSEESSVTDVLNKVTSGQADAGLVYVTDARAAGSNVTTVPFPEAALAVNTYQIAVLKAARDHALAARFVELLTGPTGHRLLGAAGFGKP